MSYACNKVEVFAAGTHRGREYTEADLQQMVDNFRQYSTGPDALLKPPAVLGHEEHQELLENSGLPAAGWVVSLWKEGPKLMAKVAGIPDKIAKLINQQSYRKVSAEIYDEPPEGIPGKGMMLRRIALLGGEIPQVKTLADLPAAQLEKYREAAFSRMLRTQPAPLLFAEEKRKPCKNTEGQTMPNLQALIDALGEFGVKPEDAPAAIDKLMPLFSGEPAAEAAQDDPAAMADPVAPAPNKEEMIAALVAKGEDAAALNAMSPEELQAKYMAVCQGAQPMADPTPSLAAPVKPAAPTNPAVPQAQPSKVVMHYAEQVKKQMDAELAQTKATLAAITKQSQDALHEAKAEKVNAFCENLKREGKLVPAQEATIKAMLLKCDSVKKFGEKNTTELDNQMESMRAWPVVIRFGEKGGMPHGQGKPEDETKAKIHRFHELKAGKYTAAGIKPEDLEKLYQHELKKNPELTVEEWAGVAAL